MAAKGEQTSTKPTMQNKSAAGGMLSLFKKGEGFYKDGYCRTGSDDSGNHSIAATVTDEFLKSSNGKEYSGVSAGDKTCLSAQHWANAMKELDGEKVPKVHLHASHEKALDVVDYKDLKKFAAQGEATNQSGRQESHVNPSSKDGAVKEKNDFGGDQGTVAPGRGKSQNVGTDTKPEGSGGPRG
ncbi:hypothetical protein CLAFUW4_08161 [Fulvia fulva]|uniref:Uncharacterized protein n=1 Tax=Passalora fulva TaxID=5499 RepID=A0A9Q8LCQ1_PASFU|nr:uncharacterized protein CLAFUR5_08275 [Fulvia fulva]KAK4629185.1 hypothetical protein CLAFUR4_08166 [Fulvia fulva]KAK4629777.1 hypothetical protein CLAFUR0_08161 [Fulvia fulva]UJO14965.1 hypothetical protein CLAFUR5_08275 [Fulvia fulva]WPV12139.1 hypothetical protein CLAFUW4_08161 [Fulvia fulva]WPV28010.1 hypothetical protein CLAFUW7_08161 [Fulvia fulva]